jgi:hypothetical protein
LTDCPPGDETPPGNGRHGSHLPQWEEQALRTWILMGISVAIATAACGSAPSSASPVTPTAPTGAAAVSPTPGASPTGTTSATSTAFAEVPHGPPAPLLPGSVTSPAGFEPVLTFEVPSGWYGNGDGGGFAIGKGINEPEQRFDQAALQFEVLDMPVANATALFAAIDGIAVGEPTVADVAGHEAFIFAARPVAGNVGLDALGTGADLNEWSAEQVFVDLGSSTLLIRTELPEAGAQAELAEVLASLDIAG